MKPPGLYLTARPIGWGVRHPSRTEDRIWDAVQEAIGAGWTVEQFRRECAEAWRTEMQDTMDDTMRRWK